MGKLEKEARTMGKCPVCGKDKSISAIVCWGKCWKGLDGLKYTPLETEE
jgi:hypothetical protein